MKMIAAALFACAVAPCQEVATPQRPTFHLDASTTASGTVEVETGFEVGRRFFGPVTAVKLGILPTLEISVSALGFQSSKWSHEYSLSVRARLGESRGVKFAIAPSATFDFRTGRAAYGVVGIAQYQTGANSVALNIGVEQVGTSSVSYRTVTTYGRALGPITCYESFLSGAAGRSYYQGCSWAFAPSVVFDAGSLKSEKTAFVFGMTANLGRLKRRK